MTQIGGSCSLRSGKRWFYFDPCPEDVDITDIAHALAMQCRWTGHIVRPYSVASHSLHVCAIVERFGHHELALSALLHDAAEAYYGDVASPLKRMLPDYKRAIAIGEDVIASALGIPSEMHTIVRRADLMALADEARDLGVRGPDNWPEPPSGLPCVDETWEQARVRFLEKYAQLAAKVAA